MSEKIEYDVFLSYSSENESLARPIWEKLTQDGLRIFWADTTLKKKAGNLWYNSIESAIESCRHFVLVCTPESMQSNWVREEYAAFHRLHIKNEDRLLIPLLANGFLEDNLPTFLKGRQLVHYESEDSLNEISQMLGGISIKKLQAVISDLKEQLRVSNHTKRALESMVSDISERDEELKNWKDRVLELENEVVKTKKDLEAAKNVEALLLEENKQLKNWKERANVVENSLEVLEKNRVQASKIMSSGPDLPNPKSTNNKSANQKNAPKNTGATESELTASEKGKGDVISWIFLVIIISFIILMIAFQ